MLLIIDPKMMRSDILLNMPYHLEFRLFLMSVIFDSRPDYRRLSIVLHSFRLLIGSSFLSFRVKFIWKLKIEYTINSVLFSIDGH